MPNEKKFVGLPEQTTIREGEVAIICLKANHPAGRIIWQASTDLINWIDISSGQRSNCYEFFPKLEDNNKYYRAKIVSNCSRCPGSISNETKLIITSS